MESKHDRCFGIDKAPNSKLSSEIETRIHRAEQPDRIFLNAFQHVRKVRIPLFRAHQKPRNEPETPQYNSSLEIGWQAGKLALTRAITSVSCGVDRR